MNLERQSVNEGSDVERNLELADTLELTVETLAEEMRRLYSNSSAEIKDLVTGQLLLISFM
jgi:hypothetical protein